MNLLSLVCGLRRSPRLSQQVVRAAALLAGRLSARCAARVEPTQALRQE
jgi:hypothetical protein